MKRNWTRKGVAAASAVVAALAAGTTVLVLVLTGGQEGGPLYRGPMPTQDLGDYKVSTSESSDVLGEWADSWSCKEEGCADGEAKVISTTTCLSSPCARLGIYDDRNGARDSVGFGDWHDNNGGDGFGIAPEGQGTISTWQWNFKFGRGFPTLPSENEFVNVTEWHSTGFNAPGHPLTINAQQGELSASSYGWDGDENRGSSAWSCQLAPSYHTGIWYKLRIHAHWSDDHGYLRIQFGRADQEGWLKTCIRDDGFGNLFHDPNGGVDEIYMAQNLYRSSVYSRDMVVFYDNTRQECALAEDGHC